MNAERNEEAKKREKKGKWDGHAGSGAVVGVDRSHVDCNTVRPFELERLVIRDVDLVDEGKISGGFLALACVRQNGPLSSPSDPRPRLDPYLLLSAHSAPRPVAWSSS